MIHIKRASDRDLEGIAAVHRIAFPSDGKNMEDSFEWVRARYASSPIYQYFVASEDEKVLGYIGWYEKGGFREDAVLELEQIAVNDGQRGRGIGTKLIQESSELIKDYLEERGSSWKMWLVTTSTDNRAQKLYEKFGAEVEATIPDMFSQEGKKSDEVIMVGRGYPGKVYDG